jgi:transcriptional regulator with XRE-family HTH domain
MEWRKFSAAQCRMARAAVRWTLTDLSTHTGISIATLTRFENGQHRPQKPYLKLIREAFEAHGVRFPERGVEPPPDAW